MLLIESAGALGLGAGAIYAKFFRPIQKLNSGEDRRKHFPAKPMTYHAHPSLSVLDEDVAAQYGEEHEDGGTDWKITSGFHVVRSKKFEFPKAKAGYIPKQLEAPEKQLSLWYQVILPRDLSKLKYILIFCHGYSDHCDFLSWYEALTLTMLGEGQLGVVLFDQPSHGRSDGDHCYIPDWFSYCDSCLDFIQSYAVSSLKVRLEKEIGRNLRLILHGTSLGGALAITLNIMSPHTFDGMILMCPMVKVSESMKPPSIVIQIFTWLAQYVPSWPICPIKSLLERCYVDAEAADWVKANNTLRYIGKPRLGTALTMMAAQDWISQNMEYFNNSVFLAHGQNDEITDPLSTQEFFSRCSSEKKQITIYPGMKHALTWGQSVADSKRVFCDILKFIRLL